MTAEIAKYFPISKEKTKKCSDRKYLKNPFSDVKTRKIGAEVRKKHLDIFHGYLKYRWSYAMQN